MLKNLLDKLYPHTNGVLVSTVNGLLDQSKGNVSKYTIEYIDDARSATFYAFGTTKSKNKPAVLLFNSDDISSAYTALFEAKYQDTVVFVIVLNEQNDFLFLDFCSAARIKIKNISDVENISLENMNVSGPVIIEIKSDFEKLNVNFEKIDIEMFSDIMDAVDKIYISGIEIEGHNIYGLIENKNYSYGTISKFFGASYYSDKKNILCCSAKEAIRDLNIFNCRYKNKNMIILIYDSLEYVFEYEEWVKSNEFEYIEVDNLTNDLLKKVVNNTCDTVIHIRKNKYMTGGTICIQS